jgi:hypothetical protein
VELHQSADGRDDASFDLELLTGLPLSWPTVALLSPTNGQVVPFGPVNLLAEAGDVDGHISSVEFHARPLAGGREFIAGSVPILERYGVNLVLCGHSHNYERSFLLNGHYGPSETFDLASMALDAGMGREGGDGPYRKPAGGLGANRGAVYAVCGNSGQGGIGGFELHPAMAFNHGGFGSIILDIDGLRLDARYLTHDGRIEDYFTLIKGAPDEDVRPSLRLTRADAGHADIAWPTSLRPYRLESAGGIEAGRDWRAVAQPPLIVGRSNVVTLPLAATNRFFRLRADP